MKYIVLHTTTDSEELAHRIAHEAISRRLAACAQIVPIHSVYRWNGKVESANEFRCEMKTRLSLASDLRSMVRELHSYEVPEMIEFAIDHLSHTYQVWLEDQLLAKE